MKKMIRNETQNKKKKNKWLKIGIYGYENDKFGL